MTGKWFRLWVLCGLAWAYPVFACTICAPSQIDNLLTQRLRVADAVVLAAPLPGGGQFQAVEGIKGDVPKGSIVADEAGGGAARLPGATGTVLLVYSAATQSWRVLGTLGKTRAEWARQLVVMGPAHTLGSAVPAAVWAKRLDFFVPDLENTEPLVAQAASDEIALAPYGAMRTLRPHLDAKKLLDWIETPSLSSLRLALRAARRPLYAMLLGIAGDPSTAAVVESKLLSGSRTDNLADVAGLFAALLELRGNAAVTWIERHYLTDTKRTDTEIQAAISALSVQGNDGMRVGRDRVVQAYATLLRHNPARSGWAASDLASWGRWEFGEDYLAVLKSGEPQAFASRYAVVLYLTRSPQPQTRAAYQAWSAVNPAR